MTEGAAGILLVLFGLIAGSFFNSFVWRYGRRRPHPVRSVCVHCKKPIQAYDLIPVISFLVLGGKCRRCRKPIPWHYPLVEAVTAVVFLLPLFSFGLTVVVLPAVALTFFLALLFLLDLRYSVLPDSLTLPSLLAAFLVSILLGRTLVDVALGAVIGGGLFFLQYVVSKGKWIGDGDIRLGLVLGIALGWRLTVLALLLSYWSGALIGLLLLVSKRKTINSTLPFGTFLAVTTYVALLYGEELLTVFERYWGS